MLYTAYYFGTSVTQAGSNGGEYRSREGLLSKAIQSLDRIRNMTNFSNRKLAIPDVLLVQPKKVWRSSWPFCGDF
jgi:hypothetical protein